MEVKCTNAFLHQLRRLSRRYRHIRDDIRPVIEQLQAGVILGEQISHTGMALFKVRVRKSDIQKGKISGYPNLKKHAVSFADAALIFEGFVISREDDRANYGEQRFISLGLGCETTVLVVVPLLEPDPIRIISARKAKPHEARHYWREYARHQGG